MVALALKGGRFLLSLVSDLYCQLQAIATIHQTEIGCVRFQSRHQTGSTCHLWETSVRSRFTTLSRSHRRTSIARWVPSL
ncbi:hypothetical protein BD310DRAFT_919774 [Dichomitus squalens]|uniref:Uncharacterized protein n=1 Tax=Dichomitus squalens TaxID=114155 RepID=A0A4Q9Q5H4_9APHY|nr:hypothetical protein BD310DRAFT_919774 [Dichomitus squalens]